MRCEVRLQTKKKKLNKQKYNSMCCPYKFLGVQEKCKYYRILRGAERNFENPLLPLYFFLRPPRPPFLFFLRPPPPHYILLWYPLIFLK